jgi:hypothetical protein
MDHHDPLVPARPPSRHDRGGGWLRNGAVLLSAFLLWVVMDSTVLQHNATVISPLGTRRTVALDVLGPIVDVAKWTRLDLPIARANEALGRTAVGGFVVPTVPTSTTTTTMRGATTTTTTTTTTVPLHPSKRHRLRILLIGDSIGTDLDGSLLNDLDASGVAVVWTDDHVDTGLVRLDYFPWIAELAHDMYVYKPQIVIGLIGGNDDQNFIDGLPYASARWDRQYLKNVGQFFTIGQEYGAKMFWASLPTMSVPGWTAVRSVQALAARQHHVVYIDSDQWLCPGGVYRMFLRINGTIQQIRTSDGVHLEPAGSDLLAQGVLNVLQRDLHFRLP